MIQMDPAEPTRQSRSKYSFWIRLTTFLAVVLIAVAIVAVFGDQLSLRGLAHHEGMIRDFGSRFPLVLFGTAFVLYVIVTGLSIPGATALTLVYGWFFGFLPAVILVSFASAMGATLAFLLSRYLIRSWVQRKFGTRLRAFNEALERDGPYYLFTLRLIPAVPFFAINAVMGLTGIRTVTFWWVSQVGMLPATVAYVYAGSTVPDLTTLASQGVASILSWQLIVAFAVLGLLPLLFKKILDLVRGPLRSKST